MAMTLRWKSRRALTAPFVLRPRRSSSTGSGASLSCWPTNGTRSSIRFYAKWTRGRLGVGELASYAEEFDRLLGALQTGWGHAARKTGGGIDGVAIAHAAEETPRRDLWRAFARATGWDLPADYWYGAHPYAATRASARIWSGEENRPLVLDLLTLHVVETTQSVLSVALLDGLRRHYGGIGDAAMYFRIQERDSRAHATVARAALQASLDAVDPFTLLSHAAAVHRAYWEMLDSVAQHTSACR